MATVTKPIALDESFNTTEVTPRNIADVLAEGFSHITGRTASEVEYDNTESGLTADNVQDAIDELSERPTLPSVDIQTAVDEFETYNGGLLSECKVALSPNQDLHGYENPWVGGASKQLYNHEQTSNNNILVILNNEGSLDAVGTPSSSVSSIRLCNPTLMLKAGTYKATLISGNNLPSGVQLSISSVIGGSWTRLGIGGIGETFTFTLNDDNTPIGVTLATTVTAGTAVNITNIKLLITADNVTDRTWCPYSNICPISGHTQVDLDVVGKNEIQFPSFADKTQNGITFKRINESKIRISGTATGNAYLFDSVVAQFTLKEGTYTASCNLPSNQSAIMRVFGIVNGTASILADNIKSGSSVSFNLANDTEIFAQINVPSGSNFATGFDAECQIELGSTATAYEPYNGYQVTVNLGGTYYSGTLDVVSGVFTPDTASDDLGTLTWQTRYTGSVNKTLSSSLSQKPLWAETAGEVQCEDYKYNGKVSGASILSDPDNCEVGFYLYYSQGQESNAKVCYLVIPVDNSPDGDVVYELNDTTPIQLSPTMVKALVGENHLSAPLDGQEITESKYKQMFTFDDVNTQIESTYSEGISHNSVYRGKYLGDHVTDEQWDAIGDGSFRDLYIGDYWAINGINWRIAHFNYWLGTGDVKCNTNHVVIVPYGWVSTFNMNASDDTTGGYLNSEWYTTNRHFAVENIEADFGASHILSHRNFFSDAVSDGHASHGMWVDSTVDLMNEIMVCGSLVGSYSGKYYEVGCDKFQLALFKYNPPSARMDVSYWLRGVSTASSFVAMGNFGLLDGFTASQILKIRPVFAIKK